MLQRPSKYEAGWTSGMLPIAYEYKGRGCYLGTHPMGGGNRGHGTMYIYIHMIYSIVLLYIAFDLKYKYIYI